MKNEWSLLMDFCREKKYPPAQKWAWDKAKLDLKNKPTIKNEYMKNEK